MVGRNLILVSTVNPQPWQLKRILRPIVLSINSFTNHLGQCTSEHKVRDGHHHENPTRKEDEEDPTEKN